MRTIRVKPHQVVLAIGVLAALGAIASGIIPRITEWHDVSPISREVFVNVPDPIYWMFYAVAPLALFLCAWLVAQRVQNYERGKPDDRSTDKQNVHRRLKDFRSGVWMQHAPARPGRGRHALVHLLRVPGAVRGDDHPGDRPPAARQPEVPARRGVPGVRGDGRHLRGRLRRRDRVGDRAALRAAPIPDPHQDQARGRRRARHLPRHRGHRLPHRGVPARARGDPLVRALVAGRVPDRTALRRLGRRHALRRTPRDVARALRCVPGVPDPARRRRSSGTWSHRR